MNDNLFGGLGSNTPEFCDIGHLFAKLITNLSLGVKDFGILDIDFSLFVLGIFYNHAELKNFHFAIFFVIAHFNISAAAIFFPRCRLHSLFNGFNKQRSVNAAFPADLVDDTFQFREHVPTPSL